MAPDDDSEDVTAGALEWSGDALWLGARHLPASDHGIRLDPEGITCWTTLSRRRHYAWDAISKLVVSLDDADNRLTWRRALHGLAASLLPLLIDGPSSSWVRVDGQLGDVWHQFDATALASWQAPLSDVEAYAARAVPEALWRDPRLRERLRSGSGRLLVRQLAACRTEAEVRSVLGSPGAVDDP